MDTPTPESCAWIRGVKHTAYVLTRDAVALFYSNGPDYLPARRKAAWALRLGEQHGFAADVEAALRRHVKEMVG